MLFWVFIGLLMVVSAPMLLAIAMMLSVPIAVVAGLSAWRQYSLPIPPPDALYLSPMFWVIEVVGGGMPSVLRGGHPRQDAQLRTIGCRAA